MSVTAYSTVVGVFSDQAMSDQAEEALAEAGFARENLHSFVPGASSSFFGDLKSFFTGEDQSGNVVNDLNRMGLPGEEVQYYADAYNHGYSLLAITLPDPEQKNTALSILHQFGAYTGGVPYSAPDYESSSHSSYHDRTAPLRYEAGSEDEVDTPIYYHESAIEALGPSNGLTSASAADLEKSEVEDPNTSELNEFDRPNPSFSEIDVIDTIPEEEQPEVVGDDDEDAYANDEDEDAQDDLDDDTVDDELDETSEADEAGETIDDNEDETTEENENDVDEETADGLTVVDENEKPIDQIAAIAFDPDQIATPGYSQEQPFQTTDVTDTDENDVAADSLTQDQVQIPEPVEVYKGVEVHDYQQVSESNAPDQQSSDYDTQPDLNNHAAVDSPSSTDQASVGTPQTYDYGRQNSHQTSLQDLLNQIDTRQRELDEARAELEAARQHEINYTAARQQLQDLEEKLRETREELRATHERIQGLG